MGKVNESAEAAFAATDPVKKAKLAIILGASDFPYATELKGSPAFANSAGDFTRYLMSSNGLDMSISDICSFFDDTRTADEIDEAISQFLKRAVERHPEGISTVFLYYVGHGMYDNQSYVLALWNTRQEAIGASAYRWRDLAKTVHSKTSGADRVYIIDACFAGGALVSTGNQRMGGGDVAELAAAALSDDTGSALLCATSRYDYAFAPIDNKYTMFSEGLLHALRNGDEKKGESLTLEDIRNSTVSYVQKTYPKEYARPELHFPDQTRGHIADAPMFPNRAKSAKGMGDELLKEVSALAAQLRSSANPISSSTADQLNVSVQESVANQARIFEAISALANDIRDLKDWINRQIPGANYPAVSDPRPAVEAAVDQAAWSRLFGFILVLVSAASLAYASFHLFQSRYPLSVDGNVDRPWWAAINAALAIFLLAGVLMSREKGLTAGLEPFTSAEQKLLGTLDKAVFLRFYYAIPVRRLYVATAVILLSLSAGIAFWPGTY